MAVLSFGKDTLIGLDGEGHSVTLKPLESIGWSELFEKMLQQVCPTRINLPQISHISKCVGAVASSATRNLHLSKHFFLPFKDGDFQLWHQLLGIDGQEESRCASTHYGEGGSVLLLNPVRH